MEKPAKKGLTNALVDIKAMRAAEIVADAHPDPTSSLVGTAMAFATAQWSPPGPGGNLTVVDKVPEEMLFLVDPHWLVIFNC